MRHNDRTDKVPHIPRAANCHGTRTPGISSTSFPLRTSREQTPVVRIHGESTVDSLIALLCGVVVVCSSIANALLLLKEIALQK